MKYLLIILLIHWGPILVFLFLITKFLPILSVGVGVIVWIFTSIIYNYFLFKLLKSKTPMWNASVTVIMFMLAVGLIDFIRNTPWSNHGYY
jgi:hypothetical protein